MSSYRIKKILNKFNEVGYTKAGMNRLAYTINELNVKKVFKKLCEDEGMSVEMDEAGNMIACKKGKFPNLPPVSIGSHLDTVINGGQYDGTVGVVSGIELVSRLNEKNIYTDRSIEVICFAAEESSRFGISTIGSKFMNGSLNETDVYNLKDKQQITLAEAFKEVELDINKVGSAFRKKGELKAFFEVHIEQGPILEKEGTDIGVVTGMAAPTRIKVNIEGKAGHSGTTPMHLRQDAFLAASELALFIEKIAKEESIQESVATVGDCTVLPGAMNVIPEKAEMKIDIRSINIDSKQRIFEKIKLEKKRIEKERTLSILLEVLTDDAPVFMDEKIIASISEICKNTDTSYKKMPSGAGHDAMNMAKICPSGMIFIPCRNGLSHHKDEFASLEAIEKGCDVLETIVTEWSIKTKTYP